MRVLVGGVGYRNLSDHSFGILVSDALATRAWPATVAVEDISYNPIALTQRLQDEPAERRFDVAVIVSAVDRPGRPAGLLSTYRWDNVLPPAEDIQASVAEAVTGIIALDNTLVVTGHFGALPDTVVVVEVQPRLHEFGGDMSAEVAESFDRACQLVSGLALNPADARQLTLRALGGGQAIPKRPAGVEVKHAFAR